MQGLSLQAPMRSKRKGAGDFANAHLARISGLGGGLAQNGERQGNLRQAQGDHRTGLCRRKRETRDAVYAYERPDPGDKLGEAKICCDEPEKAGRMELEQLSFCFDICDICVEKSKNSGFCIRKPLFFDSLPRAARLGGSCFFSYFSFSPSLNASPTLPPTL